MHQLAKRTAASSVHASSTCAFADGQASGEFGGTVVVRAHDNAGAFGNFTAVEALDIEAPGVVVSGFAGRVTVRNAKTIEVADSVAHKLVITDSNNVNVTIRSSSGHVGVINSKAHVVVESCSEKLVLVMQTKRAHAGGSTVSIDASCADKVETIDLVAMLNVFGSDYEMKFFDAKDLGRADSTVLVAVSSAAAGVAIVLAIFVCFKR